MGRHPATSLYLFDFQQSTENKNYTAMESEFHRSVI